jgi:hypothetical protein
MRREEVELLAGNTDFKYCLLLLYMGLTFTDLAIQEILYIYIEWYFQDRNFE